MSAVQGVYGKAGISEDSAVMVPMVHGSAFADYDSRRDAAGSQYGSRDPLSEANFGEYKRSRVAAPPARTASPARPSRRIIHKWHSSSGAQKGPTSPQSDSPIFTATSVSMDRLAPAPSFRTTRPTRSRTRTRPMSPSPRPNLRKPFTDSVSSTMFITTDYDYDHMSPSSPDSDFIFSMSPIQPHILPSSPPGREPVNVMTLRNKMQRKNNSPPLSPLLYSFPRPSKVHPYMQQNTAAPKDIFPSKPLASISQNLGTWALDSVRSASPSHRTEAGQGIEDRPLAASIADSFLHHAQKQEAIQPSHPTRSPLDSQPSSPIPIPRHNPRQSDPGPFVTHSISQPSAPLSYNLESTPLPSSGIASHMVYTGLRSAGRTASGSSASPEPLRIEGFDESECGPPDTDNERIAAALPDLPLSVASSTAYSFADSAPLRLPMFLDSDPGDKSSGSADGSAEKGNPVAQRDGYLHRGCTGS
ncbi:hypothetical protein JB92DRAFT_2834933 [Gautieria morchelliformis]|nr:hypothetical protein JB92DRAFT_2834933 [Gautieria morchelliformis]